MGHESVQDGSIPGCFLPKPYFSEGCFPPLLTLPCTHLLWAARGNRMGTAGYLGALPQLGRFAASPPFGQECPVG